MPQLRRAASCRALIAAPPRTPAVRTTLKLSAIVTGPTFDPSTKAAYLAALRAKLPREAGRQPRERAGGCEGTWPTNSADILRACPE